ncbi:MAG: protein kinase [Treponema sp.]|nr:protein kinase [Treponema sp.]
MEIDSIVNNYIKANPEIRTPLTNIIIGKRVNSGGTAIVHEAELKNYNGKFVIKLFLENISDKESSAYKRFKHTFINLQIVHDSNIFMPQVYFYTINISEELCIPFTIMPHAEYTLSSYVKDKEMTFELWYNIFNDLGQKIEKMHNLKIIHRDLKPQNLFLLNGKLLIGDCDIASFDKEKYIKLVETKPSDRLGNYSFSAPEQADKNIDEITPAADWYAFGQILYWLVHQTTIRGFQTIDLKFKQPIYNEIISKLLSQNPNDRFQNFTEIQNAITAYQKKLSKQKDFEKQYYHAIQTTELFDEIIFKYTFEVSASMPCIKSISQRNEIDDIILFLQNNCDRLSLWISQGHSDLNIKKISFNSTNETYSFDWYEMKIEKLIIFRLGIYPGGSLIMIITKNQESVISPSENIYEDEEVCYYKDKIISRPEYDNGWTIIDGQRIQINSDDTEVKIRTLLKTVYFVSPQNGLFLKNMEIFETIHNAFLKDNTLDEDYFFELLKNAKRADIVKLYD